MDIKAGHTSGAVARDLTSANHFSRSLICQVRRIDIPHPIPPHLNLDSTGPHASPGPHHDTRLVSFHQQQTPLLSHCHVASNTLFYHPLLMLCWHLFVSTPVPRHSACLCHLVWYDLHPHHLADCGDAAATLGLEPLQCEPSQALPLPSLSQAVTCVLPQHECRQSLPTAATSHAKEIRPGLSYFPNPFETLQ